MTQTPPHRRPDPARLVSAIVRASMVAVGVVVVLLYFSWSHPLTLALVAYLLAALAVVVGLRLRPTNQVAVWANLLMDPFAIGSFAYLMGPAHSPAVMILVIPMIPITVRSGPTYAKPYLALALTLYLSVLIAVTAGWVPPMEVLSPLEPRAPTPLEAIVSGVIVLLATGVSFPYLMYVLREKERTDQRSEALEQQLAEARGLESLGRLAGGIAHDFNNLLAVVLGNAGLVAEHGHDAAAIHEIEQAARRARDLTEQLLAFSRQQSLGRRVIDLEPLLASVVEAWTRAHSDTPVRRTPCPGPCPVAQDPDPLYRALLALLDNAREASPEGATITLRATLSPDDAGPPSHAGSFVQVTVEDSGRGMDEDTARRAFQPFFTTKDLGQGVGLGLSMVYGTVRQQGGDVRIESTPGQGTRVHLLLPLAATETQAQADVLEGEDPPPTILVVDDEDLVRRMTARVIRQEGYATLEASSGREALDVIAESGVPDLVLTDIRMPDLSGPELAEHLSRSHPELPVVFMSGFVDEVVAVGTLHRDQILPKPFGMEELRRHVGAALRDRE